MAYTLFPKTTKEILDKCKAKPDNAVEIATLFKYLSKTFLNMTIEYLYL